MRDLWLVANIFILRRLAIIVILLSTWLPVSGAQFLVDTNKQLVISIEGDSLSAPYNGSAQGTNTWSNYFTPIAKSYGAIVYNWATQFDYAVSIYYEYDYEAGTVAPTNGQYGIFAYDAGVNDLGRGIDINTVYLTLSNIWLKAKASGYWVVAFTITPNFLSIQGQNYAQSWTNLNNRIIASSNLWDQLITPNTIIQSAVQTVDALHCTPAASRSVANLVASSLFDFPHVQVQRVGDNLQIDWLAPGFILQSSPGGGAWTDVADTSEVTSYQVSLGNTPQWFRLRGS